MSGERAGDELDERLADAFAAGQAAWPGLALDAERYTRHVRALLDAAGDDPVATLATLHTVDLYLACACVLGVRGADRVLEDAFLVRIDVFVRRVDASPAFADEVRQALREKLLLASADRPPRLAEYSGSGPLGAWLRVAALRTALNLRRDRGGDGRVLSLDQVADIAAEGGDAELELIKERYRDTFRDAVHEALAGLPDEQRRAMRLHLVGRVTTARLGQMFQVNQSTVVRWLAQARTTVRERTHELLRARLALAPAELDGLAALLFSRLDVSLEAALRTMSD